MAYATNWRGPTIVAIDLNSFKPLKRVQSPVKNPFSVRPHPNGALLVASNIAEASVLMTPEAGELRMGAELDMRGIKLPQIPSGFNIWMNDPTNDAMIVYTPDGLWDKIKKKAKIAAETAWNVIFGPL